MSNLMCKIEDFLKGCGTIEVPPNFMELLQQRVINAPEHVNDPNVLFRASKLGRPWILQMLEKWYGGNQLMFANNALAMITGNLAQEAIVLLLELSNLATLECEVKLSNLGVVGHCDIIATSKDEIVVIEVKTMAAHLVKEFCDTPHDNYGYLSQLSFYADRVAELNPGVKVSACFVVYEPSRKRFYVVPIMWDAIQRRCQRYKEMVPVLRRIAPYDLPKLLNTVDVPPTFNGKIPPSMTFSKWASYLYVSDGAGGYQARSNEDIIERLGVLNMSRRDGASIL